MTGGKRESRKEEKKRGKENREGKYFFLRVKIVFCSRSFNLFYKRKILFYLYTDTHT
jgi:hypothetical protein